MKLKLRFNKNFFALFSNIGKPDNEFYLLAVFHKSKKGGFNADISRDFAQKILTKHNPLYRYVDF